MRITYVEVQPPRWYVPWELRQWVRGCLTARRMVKRMIAARDSLPPIIATIDPEALREAQHIEDFLHQLYEEIGR